VAVRAKSPEPDSIEALGKVVRQAYVDGYAAAEKAFADAATAGRQVNDRAIVTLAGQGDALLAAYNRIAHLEACNAKLLSELDGLGTSYARKELVESTERIEKDRTEKDFQWKQALVEKCGPSLPRIAEMLMGRLGLPGASNADAEDHAALMRAIPKLLADTELASRIQTVVGDSDWQRILAYLSRLAGGGPAPAHANGAQAN
jgi:hypothetical protein